MKIFNKKKRERERAALLNLCDVDIEILYAFQNHSYKAKVFSDRKKEM